MTGWTARRIVARFETEIRKALDDPEISKKLEEVGIVPVGSSGARWAVDCAASRRIGAAR